jgi:hypothetical protein
MTAQHPPPTTTSIRLQGGAGANSYITTHGDGQRQRGRVTGGDNDDKGRRQGGDDRDEGGDNEGR